MDHTFATGGSYSVTLTVTDDRGGKDTETKNVVATAPANHPFAADAFSRTAATGLGAADLGGTWSLVGGATSFAVNSGVGIWKLPTAGASRTAYLGSTLRDSTDLTMDLSPSVIANGGGTYLTVLGRRITDKLDYRTNVKVTSAGKVTVSLGALPGLHHRGQPVLDGDPARHDRGRRRDPRPDADLRDRLDHGTDQGLAGLGQRTFGLDGVRATDSYAGLQAPGSVGLTAYVSGSTTTLPVNVSVPELVARPVV